MRIKPAALVIIAVICILHPLMRFMDSPTFETARAVDILLVFASGMMTGILISALRLRFGRPETGRGDGSH